MTAVENLSSPPPPPPPPLADDDQLYHSDDVGLRDTPPLEPKKVNLQPSPSPPLAIPSPEVTPESSPEPPDCKRPDRDATRHRRRQRPRNRPSQGDAVLVHFMDGGKWPDVAQIAGQEPLPSDDDDEEGDDAPAPRRVTAVDNVVEKDVGNSLAAIAAGALAHQGQAAQELPTTRFPQDGGAAAAARRVEGEPVDGMKSSIPPIASTYTGDARRPPSPDASIKPEAMTPSTGGLPPIRQHSPKSHLANGNGTGPITLPSISDQLRDLNHLAEAVPTGDSPFPQSPPSRPPHLYPAAPTHGSPPKSPNDTFRRGLPSPSGPGHYYYAQTNHQRIAHADTTQYANAGEYSSSNTETPSTDQSVATPALPIDRMSIDGITNPQVGGYQCSYPGCTAQPFQTQVSSFAREQHIQELMDLVSLELAPQCALVDPAALLPSQGLPAERGRQGVQEEE
jgi:hypothetical protein